MFPSALLLIIPFVVLASLFIAARNNHSVSAPAFTFLFFFVFLSAFPPVFDFLHPALPKAEHVSLAILRAALGAAVIYLVAPRRSVSILLSVFLITDTIISLLSLFLPVFPPLLAPHLDFLFPIATALVQLTYLIRTCFPSRTLSSEPSDPFTALPKRNLSTSLDDIERASEPSQRLHNASLYMHTSRAERIPCIVFLLLMSAQCAASISAVLNLYNVTHSGASVSQILIMDYIESVLTVAYAACLTGGLVLSGPQKSSSTLRRSRMSMAPSLGWKSIAISCGNEKSSRITMSPPPSPIMVNEKSPVQLPDVITIAALTRAYSSDHATYTEFPVPAKSLPLLPSPTISISTIASKANSMAPLIPDSRREVANSQRFSKMLRSLFGLERIPSTSQCDINILQDSAIGRKEDGRARANAEDFTSLSDPFAPPPPKVPTGWTNVDAALDNAGYGKWAWGALPVHNFKRKGQTSPVLRSNSALVSSPILCTCNAQNPAHSPPSSLRSLTIPGTPDSSADLTQLFPTPPLKIMPKANVRVRRRPEVPGHYKTCACHQRLGAAEVPLDSNSVGEDAMLAEMLLRRLTRDCKAESRVTDAHNGHAPGGETRSAPIPF